jgi:hypothetical protein
VAVFHEAAAPEWSFFIAHAHRPFQEPPVAGRKQTIEPRAASPRIWIYGRLRPADGLETKAACSRTYGSLLIEFDSAVEALGAAIECQQVMADDCHRVPHRTSCRRFDRWPAQTPARCSASVVLPTRPF